MATRKNIALKATFDVFEEILVVVQWDWLCVAELDTSFKKICIFDVQTGAMWTFHIYRKLALLLQASSP